MFYGRGINEVSMSSSFSSLPRPPSSRMALFNNCRRPNLSVYSSSFYVFNCLADRLVKTLSVSIFIPPEQLFYLRRSEWEIKNLSNCCTLLTTFGWTGLFDDLLGIQPGFNERRSEASSDFSLPSIRCFKFSLSFWSREVTWFVIPPGRCPSLSSFLIKR